jgi:hypothetical protein
MNLLFDEEVADLEPELQQLLGQLQQQQQQQPAVTAMDWVLGEYADAAAGSQSLLTVDDEGGYIDESTSSRISSSRISSSSSSAAAATSNFKYKPSELGASDLQRLIQQYSWNAEKHPLLLEATMAAGLYPNYVFGDLLSAGQKLLNGLKERGENGDDIQEKQVRPRESGQTGGGVRW